jgi:hypothetical protein
MHAVEQFFILVRRVYLVWKPNCNLKTTITEFFEQKSQTKSLIAQGGGTIEDF